MGMNYDIGEMVELRLGGGWENNNSLGIILGQKYFYEYLHYEVYDILNCHFFPTLDSRNIKKMKMSTDGI